MVRNRFPVFNLEHGGKFIFMFMFYLILNILLAILSIANIVVHKHKLDKIFWSLFAIYSVVMSITKIATMM